MIDTSTEFGAHVARRLDDERIAWLTTVRRDGTPQSSPVWFLWDGETFLIYSQPQSQKLRNIAHNPKVGLHLNADRDGTDVVIFNGEARVVTDVPAAHEVPGYAEKYVGDLGSMDELARQAKVFSVAIRVTPTNLRDPEPS